LDEFFSQLNLWKAKGLNCKLKISYLLNNNDGSDNVQNSKYCLNELHQKYAFQYTVEEFYYPSGYSHNASSGSSLYNEAHIKKCAKTYVYNISKYKTFLIYF
jgi:hypothetical protein